MDPIGFSAGDNNWYRFVANGPTGKTDPSGLLPDEHLACRADAYEKARKDRDERFQQRLAALGDEMHKNCSALPAVQREACDNEVQAFQRGLTKAYRDIYAKGGPQRFYYVGPVCTVCEETVNKYMPPVTTFFKYNMHHSLSYGYKGWGHHVWGELRCQATGRIFTIDFWEAGERFWYDGKVHRCECCGSATASK